MDSSAAEMDEAVTLEGALLDGEDPASAHRDDPEHWVAVYSELVQATNRMLDSARERLGSRAASDHVDAELIERELAALTARSKFFTSRLRWWAKRGNELWVRVD